MLSELKRGSSTHEARLRHRRRRFAIHLSLTIIFLALISIVAVMGYVWYIGKTHPVESPKPVVNQPVATTRPAIATDAPVGVAVEAVSLAVKPGSNASISIKTRPEAACSIKVTYDKTASTDAGLVPKTADEFGVVMWTWSVETNQPVGSWPVEVTCAYNGKSGYGKTMITVKND